MSYSVASVHITKVNAEEGTSEVDLLAVEEPLEIRMGFGEAHKRLEKSLSVTMRTPGNDEELVIGFLLSESIIRTTSDLLTVKYCHKVQKEEEKGNVVKAELHNDVPVDLEKLQRHFYTTSSCGVCGKSSIEAVQLNICSNLPDNAPVFDADLIHTLPDKLRSSQKVFEHTGGLHAAALFDAQGALLLMREDVGRHNALDKLIGAAAMKGLLPLHDYIVQVSGRASFELIQKALVAGAPALSAVGAPSSLAVKLAESGGMTLMGFVRNNRYNIYTGAERIRIRQKENSLAE